MTQLRPYVPETDLAALLRIWREYAWIEDTPEQRSLVETFLSSGHSSVAEMDGEVECLVHWAPGSMWYQAEPLRAAIIGAVTTSHIGRKQGFASALTLNALEEAAADGCAVAVLGMFEQGFYDRLGFATGPYDNKFSFDPASLLVEHVPFRNPVRLSVADFADMHDALLNRHKVHGSVVVDTPETVQAEFAWLENGFAFGYRDDSGQLTHFILGELKDEYGPFIVHTMAYRNTDQLLELLRLLHELADQFRSVTMAEPPEVQLQVLLRDLLRERERTEKAEHASFHHAGAWWQGRILDLEATVAARHFSGGELRFNATIADPVADRVSGAWPGIGGDYTIVVGEHSHAEAGHSNGLALLECDVSAFTRLWLGVAPASSLTVTDQFEAPPELVNQLDDALRLPTPRVGIDF